MSYVTTPLGFPRFHVRKQNGGTVDMLPALGAATDIARKERASVYRITADGRSTKVWPL